MKIERLNGYTLVARTNFPFLAYVFFGLTIACGVVFLSLHDSEPKSLCGIGIFVFGLITALITKRSEAVFDSRKKTVTVSSGGLSMKTLEPVSFDQVKSVRIERATIANKPYGRVVLVLEDTVVPLCPTMQSYNSQLEKDAKQLIRFVECQEPLSSYEFSSTPKALPQAMRKGSNAGASYNFDDVDKEVIELVRKKRLIEAIKIHRANTGLGLKESKDVVDEIQRRMKNGLM
ncbi:MAG: hypothetical protein SFY67_19380 [Candidatus Melainabacteria bacterium]|nr:hypothetical protein [Candidatus Melainabacteria bacterium]